MSSKLRVGRLRKQISLFTFVLVLAAQLQTHSQAEAVERLPSGISVRMTMVGPAFVDAHGMTLYYREREDISCPDRPEVRLINRFRNRGYDFLGKVPDADSRRACADKFPVLVAPAEAKPFGDWSIVTRKEGVRQWAWRGEPLHTSIKDRAPGEVNARQIGEQADTGQWAIAAAPLDAPPEISWRLTTLGVALSTYEGKTLYYTDSNAPVARGNKWLPLQPPDVIAPDVSYPKWSIVNHEDGSRQWTWDGHPLYIHADDNGDQFPPDSTQWQFVDVFGDPYGRPLSGWHAALLRPAPGYPAEVRVVSHVSLAKNRFRNGYGDRIYADSRGKTLYIMRCVEGTEDQLDCNDVGDSPRYWLRFCGSEERCTRTWTPLAAPPHAKSIDALWKVVTIDPHNPWKPLQAGQTGLDVWAFSGQPIFTYVHDRRLGDTGDYNGLREYEKDTINPTPLSAFVQQ